MKHEPALDGLRGIAVSLVLITHFWQYPNGWTFINRLAAAGWIGVDLFFVLSGFLITRILWESRGEGYFRNFYARRTLRIFPLYYLVLAFVLLVMPAVTTLPERLMSDRALYFLYLSNVALAVGGWQLFLLDITWSLAIEEQFYLVWPTVVRWLSARRLIVACLALVVLAPIARLIAWQYLNWRWLHMFTPFRADGFAIGALLALVPVNRRVAFPSFVVLVSLVIGLVLTGHFARDSRLVGTLGYSLTAALGGLTLVLARSSRWLTVRALSHVGMVSYGVYLLHPLCLAIVTTAFGVARFDMAHLTGHTFVDALLSMAIASGFVIAVATASYNFYEMPFLRLKRRFTPHHAREIRTPLRMDAVARAREQHVI